MFVWCVFTDHVMKLFYSHMGAQLGQEIKDILHREEANAKQKVWGKNR